MSVTKFERFGDAAPGTPGQRLKWILTVSPEHTQRLTAYMTSHTLAWQERPSPREYHAYQVMANMQEFKELCDANHLREFQPFVERGVKGC